MFSKRFDCVAWAILLFGVGTPGMCPAQQKPKEQSKQSVVAESGSHAVVLPASEGQWFFPKGTKYWMPAAADIARLEKGLPELAKTSPKPRPYDGAPEPSIMTYYRQYIGVIQGGRRCIYVNAFRDRESKDWRQHAVRVADGGDAFYNVIYDVQKRKFGKLEYNGYG